MFIQLSMHTLIFCRGIVYKPWVKAAFARPASYESEFNKYSFLIYKSNFTDKME